jgi:hypothetical protein
MGARTKLNLAYFNGSLMIAALLGLLAESWPLLFVTLAVLLAANLYFREIRPTRRLRGLDPQKPRRGERP